MTSDPLRQQVLDVEMLLRSQSRVLVPPRNTQAIKLHPYQRKAMERMMEQIERAQVFVPGELKPISYGHKGRSLISSDPQFLVPPRKTSLYYHVQHALQYW